MTKIKKWTDNICNHFWYCCRNCDGDAEKLEVQCMKYSDSNNNYLIDYVDQFTPSCAKQAHVDSW